MRRIIVLLVLLTAVGCSTAARSSGGGERSDSRVILTDELESANVQSAFDAVSRLRPGWLKLRGQGSFRGDESILVYVDGTRRGGPEVLRSLRVGDIAAIERLRSLEASQRFGIDHPNGAIVVRTR